MEISWRYPAALRVPESYRVLVTSLEVVLIQKLFLLLLFVFFFGPCLYGCSCNFFSLVVFGSAIYL